MCRRLRNAGVTLRNLVFWRITGCTLGARDGTQSFILHISSDAFEKLILPLYPPNIPVRKSKA